MITKQDIIEQGLHFGSIVKLDFQGLEVFGIIKEFTPKFLIFSESFITKSKRGELSKISLKKDDSFLNECIDNIESISKEEYIKNLQKIKEAYVSFVGIFTNFNSLLSLFSDKSIFLKKDSFIYDGNNIKFKIKTNKTKANWCCIKKSSTASILIEFVSEYKDKQKNIVVSSLKEMLEIPSSSSDEEIKNIFEKTTGLKF